MTTAADSERTWRGGMTVEERAVGRARARVVLAAKAYENTTTPFLDAQRAVLFEAVIALRAAERDLRNARRRAIERERGR